MASALANLEEQSVRVDVAPKRSTLGRWAREPLLHFVAVGLLLFAVYRVLDPPSNRDEKSNRIELTSDDVRQIDAQWRAQWQRAPTAAEMHGLLESKVREEVLFREALALGLDRGDSVVIRRLAQKMEFLAEDTSALAEPSGVELKSWFDKNRGQFALPGRISFHHLYFSPDRHGAETRAIAAKALAILAARPADYPKAARLADPFMSQDYFADRERTQVANVFGTQFAQQVWQFDPGSWQGPIESGLGWHVVFVDSITPGRVPAYEEVEPDVKSAWMAAQKATASQQAYAAMRARYVVVLPNVTP